MGGGTCSRRCFLAGGALTGGFFAAPSLPAVESEKPSGDMTPCMSISYAHIDAGAEKPFSVLHVSDTHLTEVNSEESPDLARRGIFRTRTFAGRQKEALRASLEFAERHADFVVHTGDLVDFVSEGNLAAVRSFFDNSPVKVLCSVGNHEYWGLAPGKSYAPHESNFRDCQAAFPNDLHFASRIVNGVNFVALDDSLVDEDGGLAPFSQNVADAFSKEVGRGLPIVLCVHVPFRTPLVWTATHQHWRNRGRRFAGAHGAAPKYSKSAEDFIAYLKSVPLLKGILSGHLHCSVEERFSPTAMQFIAPPNFAFAARQILFT